MKKYYLICVHNLRTDSLYYYGKGSMYYVKDKSGVKKSGDEIYLSYCYKTKKSAKDKLNKVIEFDKSNGTYSKEYWYRLLTITEEEFNKNIYYRLP